MTRATLRALMGRDQSERPAQLLPDRARRLVAAAVAPLVVLTGVAVATPAPAAADDYQLPPCAADDWIDGMAVERWGDDFKVVVTPTPDARTFGRVALNSMWHLVQACVPGLYDELADSVYGQLACHVDLAALPDREGSGFATGPTWDFESWRPPYGEFASIAHKCSAGMLSSYGGERSEPGEWEVYFGVDPLEKSEQEIERIRADREAASAAADESTGFAQDVWVINTGGVGLWTRGGPGYGAPRYEVLPDGTHLTLLCQVHSQTISDWMTSDLWDRVRVGDGSEVWVSDVFVRTGSDGQVAPTC